MSALDNQEGGTHYKDLKIQPIEYIHANGLDFFQGNMLKYLTRHKSKNGAEDLRKVIHYAQLAIELQYGAQKEYPETVVISDWIMWNGGECPVGIGTFIDVRYRSGEEKYGLQALISSNGHDATKSYWSNDDSSRDIIAYRLSAKPSQA